MLLTPTGYGILHSTLSFPSLKHENSGSLQATRMIIEDQMWRVPVGREMYQGHLTAQAATREAAGLAMSGGFVSQQSLPPLIPTPSLTDRNRCVPQEAMGQVRGSAGRAQRAHEFLGSTI